MKTALIGMTVWVDMNGFVNPNLLAVAWWMLGGGVLALAFGVCFAVAARQAYLPKVGLWMRFVLQASLFIFVGIALIFKALFNPPITPKSSLNQFRPSLEDSWVVAESAQPEPPTAKAPDISIHDAATEGDIEIVKQHLAAGADVELKCVNCGGTVLGHAVSGGHIEIVELLINKGADVNAKFDDDGATPLHIAAGEGHKEIVELLVAEGADVNAKFDDDGATPLHSAVLNNHKEIAELLISKGADVNAKVVSGAKQGMTSLDLALFNQHTKLADLLRKHGSKTGEELKAEEK